jgi:fibronectin type 3 domain-containing protein
MNKAAIVSLAIVFVALTGAALFHSSGTGAHHKVILKWHPPAPVRGVRIVGYNVYRATKSGGPYVKLANAVRDPTFTDKDVNSKIAYFYVVTAVSNLGTESRYSNEVIAKVP